MTSFTSRTLLALTLSAVLLSAQTVFADTCETDYGSAHQNTICHFFSGQEETDCNNQFVSMLDECKKNPPPAGDPAEAAYTTDMTACETASGTTVKGTTCGSITDIAQKSQCELEKDTELAGCTLTALKKKYGAGGVAITDTADPTEGSTGQAVVITPIAITPPRLNIPFPTLQDGKLSGIPETAPGDDIIIPWIGEYFAAAYQYMVGVAVILGIILIMVGGLQWSASAGNAEKVGAAKKRITSAVMGVTLALGSYLILYTVNPALVEFKGLRITTSDAIILDSETTARTNDSAQEAAQGGSNDPNHPPASGPGAVVTLDGVDKEKLKTNIMDNSWCTIKNKSTVKATIPGVTMNYDFFGSVDCLKHETKRSADTIDAVIIHDGRQKGENTVKATFKNFDKILGFPIDTPGKRDVYRQIQGWRSPVISNGTGAASSHYTIDAEGVVYQTADEAYATRHAAAYNQRSIGIDLIYSGDGTATFFTDKQYDSLAKVIIALQGRYPKLKPGSDARIMGHGDCETTGRHDPINFNFEKLGALIPGTSLHNKNHARTQASTSGLDHNTPSEYCKTIFNGGGSYTKGAGKE